MHLLNRGFADCFIDDSNIEDQTDTSSQGPMNEDVTADLNNHDAVPTADDTTLFFLEKTMKKMVGMVTLLPLIL
jgi:hypothetical protein